MGKLPTVMYFITFWWCIYYCFFRNLKTEQLLPSKVRWNTGKNFVLMTCLKSQMILTTKPCILLQVTQEFVSVIQVTGEFVSGTTSHMHCVWTCSEMREQTCDVFWHSFVLWWCLYTGLTKSTHLHCTFGPISCIGSKFTWMSTYPGVFVAVCIVSEQHK